MAIIHHHYTMNWEEGCDLMLKLFKEVTDSTWSPMYDFDFWILPFENAGFTEAERKCPFL